MATINNVKIIEADHSRIRFSVTRDHYDGVINLFFHNGETYCDRLFEMYATHGFPLSFALQECAQRRWTPCLLQFKADALHSGWSQKRADRHIMDACQDANFPVPEWISIEHG